MTELQRAGTVPGIAEVETICAIPDPIVRNLRITQAYGEMSRALAARRRSGANWCEDLARRVEDHLADPRPSPMPARSSARSSGRSIRLPTVKQGHRPDDRL